MAGTVLSEYRELVYARDRYNDNTISFACLKFIHFTASGFFLKIFDQVCAFLFLSLFVFDAFCACLHIMKSKTPVEQTHYFVVFFGSSREKRVKSMRYVEIYMKVPSAQNESCSACK